MCMLELTITGWWIIVAYLSIPNWFELQLVSQLASYLFSYFLLRSLLPFSNSKFFLISCNIKMPYYYSINSTTDYSSIIDGFYLYSSLPLVCSFIFTTGFITSCIIDFIPIIFIRLSSHDFLTHFCYGYIAMMSITIKSYSTKNFGNNIRLLTYRDITIILSYHPALLISATLTGMNSCCFDRC